MFKIYIFNFLEKDYLQIAEQLSDIGCCAYYATEMTIREITKSPSVIIADGDAASMDLSTKEVIAEVLKKPNPPIIVLISYYYNQCRENFSEYVYNRNVYFLRRPLTNCAPGCFPPNHRIFRNIHPKCIAPLFTTASRSESDEAVLYAHFNIEFHFLAGFKLDGGCTFGEIRNNAITKGFVRHFCDNLVKSVISSALFRNHN